MREFFDQFFATLEPHLSIEKYDSIDILFDDNDSVKESGMLFAGLCLGILNSDYNVWALASGKPRFSPTSIDDNFRSDFIYSMMCRNKDPIIIIPKYEAFVPNTLLIISVLTHFFNKEEVEVIVAQADKATNKRANETNETLN